MFTYKLSHPSHPLFHALRDLDGRPPRPPRALPPAAMHRGFAGRQAGQLAARRARPAGGAAAAAPAAGRAAPWPRRCAALACAAAGGRAFVLYTKPDCPLCDGLKARSAAEGPLPGPAAAAGAAPPSEEQLHRRPWLPGSPSPLLTLPPLPLPTRPPRTRCLRSSTGRPSWRRR
jgi:hypothetical protein